MKLGVVYDPMRDDTFTAERGKAHGLTKVLHTSNAMELQKSSTVTGFPYDAWNTEHDNFDNFIRFGKLTKAYAASGSLCRTCVMSELAASMAFGNCPSSRGMLPQAAWSLKKEALL